MAEQHHRQSQRISQQIYVVFSGGDNKKETPCNLWRYEVKLRGNKGISSTYGYASGKDTPLDQILETLDSMYGNEDNKEQLLAEFYTARQAQNENVTS